MSQGPNGSETRWSDDSQWFWNGTEWIPASQASNPPPPPKSPPVQNVDRGIGRNVALFGVNPKAKMFEFHVDPNLRSHLTWRHKSFD